MTVYGLKEDFSAAVWHFFLSDTLTGLIPLDGSDDAEARHSLGVLQYVNTHLLAKFPQVFGAFHEDVLGFWAHCCPAKYVPLRDASVGFLQAYITTHIAAFRTPELSERLIKVLQGLVPAMVDSVLFVEMIDAFIALYEGDEEPTARLMDLLNAISAECEKAKDEKVQNCLCSARRCYFKELVAQKREDDAAEYLARTLEMYLAAEKKVSVWNELVVSFLDVVTGLTDSGFSKCSASSLQLICQLVETESREVRDHLIAVLKRRLGK
jgi:hypothetical protein